MFDFIRKDEIWGFLDQGLLQELGHKNSFQLKTMQDLTVYGRLRDVRGQEVAEIGGSSSRLLRSLANANRCTNIDRAEIPRESDFRTLGISDISASIGDFNPDISASRFDLIFSISVAEHISLDRLDLFFRDTMRLLRPGGTFIHAIGFYLEEEPTAEWRARYKEYKSWVSGNSDVEPVGDVLDHAPSFTPSMASNPDNILYGWGARTASLRTLRTHAQHVSLLLSGRKLST